MGKSYQDEIRELKDTVKKLTDRVERLEQRFGPLPQPIPIPNLPPCTCGTTVPCGLHHYPVTIETKTDNKVDFSSTQEIL